MNPDPYHAEYDGFYAMKWHDAEENALKRWFDNYKIDRYASFANSYECLVVSEVPSTSKRGGKRYHCDIIDEGRGTHREVVMDHTAPPAPTIFFAAKRKYEPPPPKTAAQQRAEAEAEFMYRKGLRPMLEWVLQTPSYYSAPSTPASAPPPPTHRRNV